MLVNDIVSVFKASHFEKALREFVLRECPHIGHSEMSTIARSKFPVFKCFSRSLSSPFGDMGSPLFDRVSTQRAQDQQTGFASVLFLESPDTEPMPGVHG
jgi:hypothetical protein